MGSEMEIVEQRLNTFVSQLQTEFAILDRLVYKNKNQHRRCSYFQYLLKVVFLTIFFHICMCNELILVVSCPMISVIIRCFRCLGYTLFSYCYCSLSLLLFGMCYLNQGYFRNNLFALCSLSMFLP